MLRFKEEDRRTGRYAKRYCAFAIADPMEQGKFIAYWGWHTGSLGLSRRRHLEWMDARQRIKNKAGWPHSRSGDCRPVLADRFDDRGGSSTNRLRRQGRSPCGRRRNAGPFPRWLGGNATVSARSSPGTFASDFEPSALIAVENSTLLNQQGWSPSFTNSKACEGNAANTRCRMASLDYSCSRQLDDG